MRKPHFIKANHTTTTATHCIFYDTETKPLELSPGVEQAVLNFGWAAYIRKRGSSDWAEPEWKRFETEGSFWQWVKRKAKKGRKIYVFAHNQAFDMTVVKAITTLTKSGWRLKKAIIEGPPTIINFYKDSRTISFLCTLNYFRMPLKTLGDHIGKGKFIMPELSDNEKAWDTYCRQDVTIIMEAVTHWMQCIEDWDIGNFQSTLASQAFSAFRHRFMRHAIYIDDNEKALELARKSYYGGRVECFRLGEFNKRLHLLDINSQYPFVLHCNQYPIRLLTVLSHPSLSEVNRLLRNYALVGQISLQTIRPSFPFRREERLIYPVGVYSTYLSTPELSLALKHKSIVSIKTLAVYEKAPIFTDYVDYFYAKRREYIDSGDDVRAFMCKILLNSLYGKFGQSGKVFDLFEYVSADKVLSWTNIDAHTHEITNFRQFGRLVQKQNQEVESSNSHPAIAAHVTAYARILLNDLAAIAGKKNVYYCDTDSLLVTDKGLKNLQSMINPSKLGMLKHEGTFNYADIRGVKDYTLDDRVRIKGVRKNAVKLSRSSFEQDTFIGFKGMIRRGNLDQMIIRKTVKNLTRKYSKGTVKADGWIEPFILNQPLP